MTAACLASRVGRRTVYDWIAHDERFARDFDAARQDAADVLEAECRRRGEDRRRRTRLLSRRGRRVCQRRYSDACLLALLKAYRPDRFTGRGGHADGDGRTVVRCPTTAHETGRPVNAEVPTADSGTGDDPA